VRVGGGVLSVRIMRQALSVCGCGCRCRQIRVLCTSDKCACVAMWALTHRYMRRCSVEVTIACAAMPVLCMLLIRCFLPVHNTDSCVQITDASVVPLNNTDAHNTGVLQSCTLFAYVC